MIRYRCQHCAALIVAHERRAGQSSVCKTCVNPHTIPADTSRWLDEMGKPLHPAAPPVEVPEVAESDAGSETVVLYPTKPAAELPREVDDRILLAPTAPDIQLPDPPPAPAVIREREPEPAPNPEPVAAPVAASAPPARTVPAPPRPAPAAKSPDHTEGPTPQPDTGAVATATPPPPRAVRPARPPRRAAPVPVAPVGTPSPAAVQSEPVQLQTQADIAVALTAALTSRMKPKAAPRRDLRPSTAIWMLFTGIGVALILLALFSDADYRWPALVIGAAQVVAGYVWIVRLTHLRDPRRGLLCAIPPITFAYLAQYKYARLRPLRFVATGAALAAAAAAVPSVAPHTRALFKRNEAPAVAPPDPSTMSKLEQLRYHRERKAYLPLMDLLEVLAKTDQLLSEEAKDRAALTAELKGLCQHADVEVRVRAMTAYVRWERDPVAAQDVCLAAVLSQNYQEREKALELLPQWKNEKSARALQALITRPGTPETNKAKNALEEIGGAPAEQAAVELLNRAQDQAMKLIALSILEKVGSAKITASLRTYAMATDDPAVRTKAFAVADAIEGRVPVPAPAPTP